MIYDYVIIGAGVSGCVLAARLTENPTTSVLLIEAGKDTPPGQEPADILDNYPTSYYNKSYIWPNLKVSWRKHENGLTNFPQGKIMGGGGSLMGMVSLRGTPADYEEWVSQGAKNWGWNDVLPFFKKLETDVDFPNEYHGTDGPIPIRRLPENRWPPLTKAIAAYAKGHDIPFIEDQNADFRDGYGATPTCNTPDQRASTALMYLTPKVRQRSNLTMVHESQAEKILFEGKKAVGVLVQTKTGQIEYFGREILVCAGGIFSPALLMRSGIGDATVLNHLQIPLIAHRPGVGKNLQNHPILFIGFHLKKDARQPSNLRTHPSASLRYSSQMANCPPADLYINVQSKTSWNAMGMQIGNLASCVLRPKSVGHVTLQSPLSSMQPVTEFNFLSDPTDVERMMMAFTKAVEILASESIRTMMGKPFPVRFSDRLRLLNEYNENNRKRANRLATLLNIFPWMSDLVLSRLTGDAIDLNALIKNPEELAQHVQRNIAGMFHPVGSCKMGSNEDPMAVVNEVGQVYEVRNLRVIDASVMPNLIAGNTNIPTIMVAEKMAHHLIKDMKSAAH